MLLSASAVTPAQAGAVAAEGLFTPSPTMERCAPPLGARAVPLARATAGPPRTPRVAAHPIAAGDISSLGQAVPLPGTPGVWNHLERGIFCFAVILVLEQIFLQGFRCLVKSKYHLCCSPRFPHWGCVTSDFAQAQKANTRYICRTSSAGGLE